MANPTTTGKNQNIQALRGVAILLVLLAHYIDLMPTPEWLRHINTSLRLAWGVDLFFAISGFVIAKSLFDECRFTENSALTLQKFKSFWIKRFFRLMPAAWIWLLVSIPLIAITHNKMVVSYPQVLTSILAGITATANLYWAHCYAQGAGLVAACGEPSMMNVPYWSLSLEEQFYLLLSGMALFLNMRWLAILAISAIVIQFSIDRPAASLPSFVRTDALCWGFLFYVGKQTLLTIPTPKFMTKRGAGLFLALLLVTGICLLPKSDHHSIVLALTAFASGLLVLLASCEGLSLFGKTRLGQALVWMGERSYTLYLCNLPTYILLGEILFKMGRVSQQTSGAEYAGIAIISVILLMVVADQFFTRIEDPLTRLGHQKANRLLGR